MEATIATKSDMKEEIKENRKEIKRLNEQQAMLIEKEKEVATQFIIVISTALGVVSALFWHKAINTTLTTFVPVNGWNYELAIAFLITLISAMVIVTLHQKK